VQVLGFLFDQALLLNAGHIPPPALDGENNPLAEVIPVDLRLEQVHGVRAILSRQPRGSFTNQVVALANFIDPVETSVTISVRTPSVLGLATTGISTRDRVLFALSFSISALGFGLMQKRKLRVS
jgi:hypothetical protein